MEVGALTILELEGEDAHTDKVGSVDTLIGLSDHGVDTLEVGTLGSPIAGGARAVLVTSEDHELLAGILVLLSGIKDSHLLTRGDVHSRGADLRHHLVDKTDVGEGATGHDLIVTSAGAVGVEVLSSDTTLCKEAGGRGILSDLTSRRDVIGGDGVTNVKEAAGVLDASDGRDISLSGLEEGRVVDVGGGIVPFVKLARGGIEVLPHLAAIKDVVVGSLEHLGCDDGVGDLLNLGAGRPDVSQEDIVTLLILSKRCALKVELDGAGKGVGNNERRRGQVVGASVGMHTALEVTVTGKHGGGDHVVIDDAVLDGIGDLT